jgi:hypothetical protein
MQHPGPGKATLIHDHDQRPARGANPPQLGKHSRVEHELGDEPAPPTADGPRPGGSPR